MRACVCVCVRAFVCVCLHVWILYVSVHTSECLHFSMCRAIATSLFFGVILCYSQWQIFYSAANEIVLCRVGRLYRYDEKNKQLVNEIYDMFVYLIFWNCWIHLNNKWDFLSDSSQENSCIPNTLIRGKWSVKDLIWSVRLTNYSANNMEMWTGYVCVSRYV